MTNKRLNLALLGASAAALAACSGNIGSDSSSSSASLMNILEVSNGFGQLIPHTIAKLDENEDVTLEIVNIRSIQDMVDNLRGSNRIRPVPQFSMEAVLPSGVGGNHFLYARFTQDIDVLSVLNASPTAQATSGLSGSITVLQIDPITGESVPIPGRVMVGGRTYAGTPIAGDTGLALPFQPWVAIDENGKPRAVNPDTGEFLTAEEIANGALESDLPGYGFPGTEFIAGLRQDFQGSQTLVGTNVLVFIPDKDSDLSTHETFPEGKQIRMRITTAVNAMNGKSLMHDVLACTTVGPDVLGPEVLRTPPPLNLPVISPGGGDTDVDPLTTIRVSFTEPIQPLSLGHLENGEPPSLSSAILVQFGPPASRTTVPFSVLPLSPFDLSTYDLIPAFHFPGSGPLGGECGTFAEVDIQVQAGQLADLADNGTEPTIPIPNYNLLEPTTDFVTGEGPGLVNAPVSPDTIYVGRLGSSPGLSIIDLNGFGQPTGNPIYDETYQTYEEGNTYFPINPNVRFQGAQMRPALSPGTCTIDGGSAGVFTLTLDSSLNDLVIRPPIMRGVTDMMIGHSLDGTFNNGPFPFGCQSGGGNLCALDGLKIVNPVVAGNTLQPAQAGQFGVLGAGAENLISWAPHPNPPPFVFPPLCVAPYLGTQEPTSVDTTVANLLGPSDPFGDPNNGVPPTGLLSPEQNQYFMGPSIPAQLISACLPHMIRQQIGHYLYVIDRTRGEITVLNSNRMTVVDRVIVPDPTSLAMGTNLDFLAVTNQLANVVSFIDIDPSSASFHQIIKSVVVGLNPRGIAWEPDNEDILVCCEGSNSVSIISCFSLEVRKTVTSQLQGPFEIAITPRQMNFGWSRQVYFAYILNRSGKIANFESGPNSVNGWGYDDVIGVSEYTFRNPKTLQPDHIRLDSMVWIVHEGPIDADGNPGDFGIGAVSNLVIASALVGPLPLNVTSLSIPQYRDMNLVVRTSIGQNQGVSGLTGVPVDVAFDNQRNLGGITNVHNSFSAGAPVPLNGKNLLRYVPVAVNTNEPQFMFVAVPNSLGGSGAVDVFDFMAAGASRVDTNPFQSGTQSIQAGSAAVLCDYWRQ